MFGFNHWELLIVLFVALLLFGKRLPGLMGSLGKSVVEFKRGIKGIDQEADEAEEQPRKTEVESAKTTHA